MLGRALFLVAFSLCIFAVALYINVGTASENIRIITGFALFFSGQCAVWASMLEKKSLNQGTGAPPDKTTS